MANIKIKMILILLRSSIIIDNFNLSLWLDTLTSFKKKHNIKLTPKGKIVAKTGISKEMEDKILEIVDASKKPIVPIALYIPKAFSVSSLFIDS